MAKKNLEKISVNTISDFRTASDEMRDIIARKYMRILIKYNNDEINRLISEYCKSNNLGAARAQTPYAFIKAEFGKQFAKVNEAINSAYVAQSFDKTSPKLVDIMNLYGMYCFNEFQKQVIRQWRDLEQRNNFKIYDTIESLRDSIGSIFNYFTLPTGKYNYNSYHAPTVSKSGFYASMRDVCFQNKSIKCNQADLSGYELILPAQKGSKAEQHIQMYIKAKLAKEFSRIKGEKITPYEALVTFTLDDIDLEQRKLQYNEAKEEKNPYDINENRRKAQLDPEVQEKRRETREGKSAQDAIDRYREGNTIYIDNKPYVKSDDPNIYVDHNELPLDAYDGGSQYAFAYQGTRELYYGQVYERRFNESIDEHELVPLPKDLAYSPDNYDYNNNQQTKKYDDVME